MSSNLQSLDGPTVILPELAKIVEETKQSSNIVKDAKYAKLGQIYLSAIVVDIFLFRLKTPVKDTDALLESNIANLIDSRYFKGECRQKLQMGLGTIFHERNIEKMKRIESQIEDFFEMQFSNQHSCSRFIQELSISLIEKKPFISILDDDSSQFHPFSEINSFSTNDKSFDKIKKPQDFEKHIKEVQNYLKDKNGTTELNLLKDYKQKTITVENKCAVVGTMTRHTVQLEFLNFLDDGKTVKLLATEEGTNKQAARQKASKLMLKKFFGTYPYIFKDYLHCMKVKGK